MPQQKEEEMSLGKLRSLARDQFLIARDASSEIQRLSNPLILNKTGRIGGKLVTPADLRRIQNDANKEAARINRLIRVANK